MLFIVSIYYFNYAPADQGRYKLEVSVIGKDNAFCLADKYADADNVTAIEITDGLTGEVIER